MHEFRKDPLLSRWAVILEKSLKPAQYAAYAVRPGLQKEKENEKEKNPDAGQGERTAPKDLSPLIFQGKDGIKVIEGLPILTAEGGLGRKGEGIYDKMNPVGAHELVIEGALDCGGKAGEAGPMRLRTDTPRQMGAVLEVYLERFRALMQDARIRYVFIYKDQGVLPFSFAGAEWGLPAGLPHSEILATAVIPDFAKRELDGAKHYYEYKERCIFCDIMNEEKRVGSRVLAESEHFFAFCPYAQRMPFEFWILPKRHSCAFEETSGQELEDLAPLFHGLLGKMSRALDSPAYNYYIHTAPNRIPRRNLWHSLGDDYHWHIEVLPRLARMSAMDVGAGFHVIPTSPEDAARYMRETV